MTRTVILWHREDSPKQHVLEERKKRKKKEKCQATFQKPFYVNLDYDFHKQPTLFRCKRLLVCILQEGDKTAADQRRKLCCAWACQTKNGIQVTRTRSIKMPQALGTEQNLHHQPINQGVCWQFSHLFIHSSTWCVTKQGEKLVVDISVVFPYSWYKRVAYFALFFGTAGLLTCQRWLWMVRASTLTDTVLAGITVNCLRSELYL